MRDERDEMRQKEIQYWYEMEDEKRRDERRDEKRREKRREEIGKKQRREEMRKNREKRDDQYKVYELFVPQGTQAKIKFSVHQLEVSSSTPHNIPSCTEKSPIPALGRVPSTRCDSRKCTKGRRERCLASFR
jgi:hypothetical protein